MRQRRPWDRGTATELDPIVRLSIPKLPPCVVPPFGRPRPCTHKPALPNGPEKCLVRVTRRHSGAIKARPLCLRKLPRGVRDRSPLGARCGLLAYSLMPRLAQPHRGIAPCQRLVQRAGSGAHRLQLCPVRRNKSSKHRAAQPQNSRLGKPSYPRLCLPPPSPSPHSSSPPAFAVGGGVAFSPIENRTRTVR